MFRGHKRHDNLKHMTEKLNHTKMPKPIIAVIPVLALITFLAIILTIFKSDSLNGGSQVALLLASSICIAIAMAKYKVKWKAFEMQFQKTFGEVAITIIILLAVGMLAGTWMISGVVPTLIYYGIQILSPNFFLISACIIAAFVSLLSGSSWTTIATIGVALIGIGQALGISEPWTAGAIISGAYFGDKMSPLSDTTILASSAVKVDLFEHIKYMMFTTFPSFAISLVIFLIAGLCLGNTAEINVDEFLNGLDRKFNISILTLIVPVFTAILIAKKVPSLITLFLSSLLAGVIAVFLQGDILHEIADMPNKELISTVKGLMTMIFGSTHIEMGDATLNELVATRGMAGMLNTIWLIVCAMFFGSVMIASRMVESITTVIIRMAKSRTSLVGATASTGIFLNVVTGDQFLSIMLTADIYNHAYKKRGFQPKLLSRTAEDSATVTSVLIPWNTCGMTQAAVLGIPTLVYLPFCFFNIISPVMSVIIAKTGWNIQQNKMNDIHIYGNKEEK